MIEALLVVWSIAGLMYADEKSIRYHTDTNMFDKVMCGPAFWLLSAMMRFKQGDS